MTEKSDSFNNTVDSKNAEDVRMLDYFWNQRGDLKRYSGYDDWAKRNPDFARGLEQMLFMREQAENGISSYIEQLYKWYGVKKDD